MKKLPPNPKPYKPSGDLWYRRYQYDGSNSPAEITKAMTAFWLLLTNMLGAELDPPKFSVVDTSLFIDLYNRFGDDMRFKWVNACCNVRLKNITEKSVLSAYKKLLLGKEM